MVAVLRRLEPIRHPRVYNEAMRAAGCIVSLLILLTSLTWAGKGRMNPAPAITPPAPAPAPLPPPPPPPPPPVPGWQLMRMTRDKLQPLVFAIEAYHTDSNLYPPADTMAQLLPLLIPVYLPTGFDASDAWGRPLRYESLRFPPAGPVLGYRLASAGGDGLWRYASLWLYQSRWMENPAEDLVFENGGLLTRFSDPDESAHDRYFETARMMRAWGQAAEQYNTDSNQYPPGDSLEEAASHLQPDYLSSSSPAAFSALDSWRHALRYESWSTPGNGPADHYCIGSSAGDRRWEHPSLRDYAYRAVLAYDDDLILCDGQWLQLVDDPETTPAQRYRVSLGMLRTLGSTLEQYNTDSNSYPPDLTIDALLANLVAGGYISGPLDRWRLDGWLFPLRYQPMNCTGPVCPKYRLASAAADSQWEFPDLLPYIPGDNGAMSQDIVLENGQFIRACPNLDQCPFSMARRVMPVKRQSR